MKTLAKADKTRHIEKLTPEQMTAADLLAMGSSDEAVGQKINRSRQTINHWRLHNFTFQATINRRRAEVWSESADKLRSLIPKALSVLEKALDDEALSFKAAITLLRLVELPTSSIGPEDGEELLAAEAKRQADAEFGNSMSIGSSFHREHLLRIANADGDDDDSAA